MKKIVALLLALMLTLGCAAALAEEPGKQLETIKINDSLSLQGVLPDGYIYEVMDNEVLYGISFAGRLVSNDPNAPVYLISIGLNDTYAPGTKLNDLGEEDLKELEESFTADNEVSIEYLETSHGTKVMKVTETGDDRDWVDFFTVYDSYDVEMVISFPEGAENTAMTDEVIKQAMQFLSDLEFVKTE